MHKMERITDGLRGRDGWIAESLLLQCLLALPAASYWSHVTITRALFHEVTDSPNFSSTWYKGAGLEQRAVLYLFTPSLNRFLDLQTYNERELGFTTRRVWWKWFPFESLGTAAPSAESCVWFIPPLSHISCCIVNAAWVTEEERTMRDEARARKTWRTGHERTREACGRKAWRKERKIVNTLLCLNADDEWVVIMTRVGFNADSPLEIYRANYWPQNYCPPPVIMSSLTQSFITAFSPKSPLHS